MTNTKFLSVTLVLFFSVSIAAQENGQVGNGGNTQGYYTNTQININANVNKRAVKSRENAANSGALTSAEGTGEYFLVPTIVRKDPAGTAFRMNTCGAAILSLLDKNALGSLTDDETQPLTRNTVLGIAESRFRMAIKFQPNNYLYHANLASALYRQGKLDEALEAISRAIELNPNDEISKNYQETILRVKVSVRVLDDEEIENE